MTLDPRHEPTKVLSAGHPDVNGEEFCEACNKDIITDGGINPFHCPYCNEVVAPLDNALCDCDYDDLPCGAGQCAGEAELDKKRALSDYLEIDEDDLKVISEDGNTFAHSNFDYLVLTDSEATERTGTVDREERGKKLAIDNEERGVSTDKSFDFICYIYRIK